VLLKCSLYLYHANQFVVMMMMMMITELNTRFVLHIHHLINWTELYVTQRLKATTAAATTNTTHVGFKMVYSVLCKYN